METRPELVPMKCLDDSIALDSIKRYFSFDAREVVKSVINVLSDKGEWACAVCCHN